jgi:hypothetical protein
MLRPFCYASCTYVNRLVSSSLMRLMLLVVAEVVVRMAVVIMKYSVLCYRLLLSLMALTHAVTSRYAHDSKHLDCHAHICVGKPLILTAV